MTNIVQGSTNCTIVNTIGNNGNANGTIGPANGTSGQWYHWLPMVQLVKLPMVPLGEPRTEPICVKNYPPYKMFEKLAIF